MKAIKAIKEQIDFWRWAWNQPFWGKVKTKWCLLFAFFVCVQGLYACYEIFMLVIKS